MNINQFKLISKMTILKLRNVIQYEKSALILNELIEDFKVEVIPLELRETNCLYHLEQSEVQLSIARVFTDELLKLSQIGYRF